MTSRSAKLLALGPSKPTYRHVGVMVSCQYIGRWKRMRVEEWNEPSPGQPNWSPEKQPMTKLGGATGAR